MRQTVSKDRPILNRNHESENVKVSKFSVKQKICRSIFIRREHSSPQEGRESMKALLEHLWDKSTRLTQNRPLFYLYVWYRTWAQKQWPQYVDSTTWSQHKVNFLILLIHKTSDLSGTPFWNLKILSSDMDISKASLSQFKSLHQSIIITCIRKI